MTYGKIRTDRGGRSRPWREIPTVEGDPERGGIPRREAARDSDTRGAQCDVFHIHHYASIKYLHYFTFSEKPL